MKIEQRVSVRFNYNIHFTRDVFAPGNGVLEDEIDGSKPPVVVFVDSGVADAMPGLEERVTKWFSAHARCATLAAPPQRVAGGEHCKNSFDGFTRVADVIRQCRLDRHSYVIIVGGGAVLDTVGFAASVSHRGIRHIRIPTTVLSQCDSGVGVKNGINYYGVKNYFGTFTPPASVINDFEFIRLLDAREWRAGISEAFKVAIIKDRSFFKYLINKARGLANRDEEAMETLITRCARLHAKHIARSEDPFEMGSSRPLDFGHWSAHCLEALTGHRMRHGEAVAIGILIDMTIARNRGLADKAECDMARKGLSDAGFVLWHDMLGRKDEKGIPVIYQGLEEFRQHLGGTLTLIMPDHLGHTRQINSIAPEELARALEEMKTTASGK